MCAHKPLSKIYQLSGWRGLVSGAVIKNTAGEVRANGGFSQSSLSIFGNPEVSREADNLGTAMLFEEHLLEQMRRVQQPPKMRKTFGGPEGQNRPERAARQVH